MRYLLLTLSLLITSTTYAQKYDVYRINGQTILVPKESKKPLEGVGVTFNNKINFETVKNAEGVEEKKAWLWIGGCGKVYIEDSKIFELKQGTTIRIRMDGSSKCSVKSWEKF